MATHYILILMKAVALGRSHERGSKLSRQRRGSRLVGRVAVAAAHH